MSAKTPHSHASTGIARTCDVLATTRNRAVLAIFLDGLKSSRREVRTATIRAAIRRHDAATHTQLIREFSSLSETDQATVGEAHRAMPHHAAAALRTAVLDGDATLCKNACRIIQLSGDVELFSVLLKAAEDKKHKHRDDVAATILGLSSHVQQEIARWESGDRTAHHDPSFARHHLLTSLEHSLGRFAHHRRKEILDAFLLLAPVENNTLKRILHDSGHPCHAAVVAELTSSQDSGIVEQLVEMLRGTDLPPAALAIIANRTDEPFLDQLLHGMKRPVPLRVLHNMKRLNHVAWLEQSHQRLLEHDGRTQAVAVDLTTGSNLSHDAVFDLLAFLLREGLGEGRRASCQALAKFEGPEADTLILNALDDPDSGVQAAAIRQLRARRLPDALQRLVALLDSRFPEVRDAARSSLAEFNFMRYRTMFDLLDEQSARTTGVLVHKVDHSAMQKLVEELMSPSITSKLRGIEMAVAMEAASDVKQQLIELASHEHVAVRTEAIGALAYCSGPEVAAALEAASRDPNPTIAEAAQQIVAKSQTRNSSVASTAPTAGKTA